MLPVREVEKQPRARNRPVHEDLDQAPLRQQLTDAVSLEVIGNAKPVQRSSKAKDSMGGDDGAVDRHFESLCPFLELPAILPAVHLQPPVDACMVMQLGR